MPASDDSRAGATRFLKTAEMHIVLNLARRSETSKALASHDYADGGGFSAQGGR